MSLLGKNIRLKGISQKGKNKIRSNGDQWTVFAETDTVLFAPNKKGPWFFISPKNCDQNHKAGRWIKATDDEDFIVVDD